MPRGRPKTLVPPCRYCRRQFKRVEHLQRHERIHTQEKPFLCDCGCSFARKDLLARHVKQAHDGDCDGVSALSPDATVTPQDPPREESQHLPPGGPEGVASPPLTDAVTAVPPGPDEASLNIDWLWQDDPFGNSPDFASFTYQSMLFDPCALGIPDDDGGAGTIHVTAEQPPHQHHQHQHHHHHQSALASCGALPHPPPPPETAAHDDPSSRLLEGEMTAAEDERAQRPWRVSQAAYPAIAEAFSRHGARPLTRHTLSRYLEGYVRGFHEHLPFLHLPTFSPAGAPDELVMSMAAVGALYKFEHARGYELLAAARAAVDARLAVLVPDMMTTTDGASGLATLQALVALVAMSSWGDGRLVASALTMASQLAMLLRLSRLSEPDPVPPGASWRAWIAVEERRRTMMVGFALLNLQAVAFDTPPPIANREIGLNLPCAIDAWRAPTEARWRQAHGAGAAAKEVSFAAGLAALLAGRDVPEAADVSALGNYLLMHGLVQQILIERQAALGHGHDGDGEEDGPGLASDVVASLSRALQAWQRCWGGGGESTLDPLSSHGPVAFNATALLRIAYIRLVADLGPHRSVMTRDPPRLARSVARAPLPALRRSRHADVAAGQCVGVLSILARAGIGYVSRTHSHTWSIIHSLSYIECACFLSLWLRSVAEAVAARGAASLRRDERRLLALLAGLMAETEHDDGTGPWDAAGAVAGGEGDSAVIRRLAPACVGVWARVLQGEHVFQMVDDISQGLALAARMLVQQLRDGEGEGEVEVEGEGISAVAG